MRLKKSSGRGPVKNEAFYARRRSELESMNNDFHKRRKGFVDFRNMQPGAARRETLLAWMLEGRATGDRRVVYVNRRHCLQLHQDADLRYLLKKGLLVRKRESGGFSPSLGRRSGSFHTYLELA